MSPDFLQIEEVLRIHQDQIERYGGDPVVRDPGLLMSAIAQPQATFGGQFLHEGIFEMAAAYLFHLVQNHPFVDGNKRTGTVTAIVFLLTNGLELTADNESLVELVLEVAQGRANKQRIAEFFRKNTKPEQRSRRS